MYDKPSLNHFKFSRLAEKIKAANSIILTTHRQCDGDGLGAQLGLYHALRKLDKKVRVFCVDEVPRKYHFLEPSTHLEIFEEAHEPIENSDLALIFDTNDRRLVEPLFTELENKCKEVLFVDHHPVLNQGPEPTPGSIVDTTAASTGEIAFLIIKALGIRLDSKIARALYTSIAFDTQIFRYVKSSPTSHLIAAELLEHERNAELVHRYLFATYTTKKLSYLSKVLGEVQYFGNNQIAILNLSLKDLDEHDLDMDDSRDVIDMIMNVTDLKVAALFREEKKNYYKLSLRSNGRIEVLSVAERFEGGGHMFAAGAWVEGDYKEIKKQVIEQLLKRIDTPSA